MKGDEGATWRGGDARLGELPNALDRDFIYLGSPEPLVCGPASAGPKGIHYAYANPAASIVPVQIAGRRAPDPNALR